VTERGDEASRRKPGNGSRLGSVHLDDAWDFFAKMSRFLNGNAEEHHDAIGARVAPDQTGIAIDSHAPTVSSGSDTTSVSE
jgi:hypothetical protein